MTLWNSSAAHSKRVYPDATYDTRDLTYEIPRDPLKENLETREQIIGAAAANVLAASEVASPGISRTFVRAPENIPVQTETVPGQPPVTAQYAGVHAVAGELAVQSAPTSDELQVADFPPLEDWLKPEEPRLFPFGLNN